MGTHYVTIERVEKRIFQFSGICGGSFVQFQDWQEHVVQAQTGSYITDRVNLICTTGI